MFYIKICYQLQIRTPFNLILINLAVAEFLIAFVGVSMDVLSLVQDGWELGKEVCIITGTLVTTSGMNIFMYMVDNHIKIKKYKRISNK